MEILRCPECGSSNILNKSKNKYYCEECGLKFIDNSKKQIVKNKFNFKPLIFGGIISGLTLASGGAFDKIAEQEERN